MKKILITSSLALLLFSCNEKNNSESPLANNAVDKAESSISGSMKSGRNADNMVLEIYNQLLKNDKKLQDLDNNIRIINEESHLVISEYETILSKSETYYYDAKALLRSVSDSLMKKEIEREIQASSEKYDLRTKSISNLINKINLNKGNIDNQYIIFKIKKTLPEIEKYQNAHPLKTNDLQALLKKQNNLLTELKSIK